MQLVRHVHVGGHLVGRAVQQDQIINSMANGLQLNRYFKRQHAAERVAHDVVNSRRLNLENQLSPLLADFFDIGQSIHLFGPVQTDDRTAHLLRNQLAEREIAFDGAEEEHRLALAVVVEVNERLRRQRQRHGGHCRRLRLIARHLLQ